MLRREIQDCLIGKIVPESQVVTESAAERHRLFATVMLVAASVDLLAKFLAGSDDVRGVRTRMEAFTMRYMFTTCRDPRVCADVFYFGCRNPLLHSFNMYNDKFQMTLVSGQPLQEGAIWRVSGHPDRFVVSVEGLYVAFVGAITTYQAGLGKNGELRANFDKMFPDYGSIPMFTAVVQPHASATPHETQ